LQLSPFTQAQNLTKQRAPSPFRFIKPLLTRKTRSARIKGYEYARTQNPTRAALERNVAALEGARFGFAFASGMAAIDATLRLVKAGEHVVVSDNTYGGTARLFNRILANYNVEF
jgi:cystathionine beta-lyase/cystathionine gamma-synthase